MSPAPTNTSQDFPAPDQVHEVTQRHFQHPGYARPEAEHRQKLGRQPQVLLDEEGADNHRQARNARRRVDHERRQIIEAHLAHHADDVSFHPLPRAAPLWMPVRAQAASKCLAMGSAAFPGALWGQHGRRFGVFPPTPTFPAREQAVRRPSQGGSIRQERGGRGPAYASGSGVLSSRTPSCIRAAISASDIPRMSRQTWEVCWPRSGAGERCSGLAAERWNSERCTGWRPTSGCSRYMK